jgi:hypothetical protein
MSDAYSDIEIGLQTILNNIAGHPFIDWEGEEPYDPIMGVIFWRVTNIPATSIRITADIGRMHPGIFKIDVFVPRDVGLKTLIDHLILIDTAYNTIVPIHINDTKIVLKAPYRGNTVHEPAWLHGIVKIPYEGYN